MNKKNIENKLRDSFAKATPNVYDSVERDVAGLNVKRTAPRRSNGKNLFWKLASGLLSLALVVMAIVGVVSTVNQTAQASTVSLDVNPSVEIVLNRNNRVVKVNALNSDGETIIADMDFNGCQLKVAVNALIGSMLRAGYLSDMANSVLVSVDSDRNNYQTIAELVANEITLTLKQGQIEASVVSQWIQNDDEIAAIAKEYKISLGKAQLISKIVAKTDYIVEQLVELSVNELSLLLPNIDIDEDIEQSGSASDKQYIDKDEALQLALNAAKLTDVTAQSAGLRVFQQKLDYDDGVMVYEIEFAYGDYEYEVEIGAMSGDAVSFEKEFAGYYVSKSDIVIKDKYGAKTYALTLAGVEESAASNVYAEKAWYFHGTVYEVCFRTENKFYQYCVGADGVVLEEYYEMLHLSADDSYLTREQVNAWFLSNNKDGFTRLDSLERMRVTSEKTVDGRLIYTLTFISNGNQYVYKIDAVNKVFVGNADVSEVNNGQNTNASQNDLIQEIKQIIADYYWFDINGIDIKEVEEEFEHGLLIYEVEFKYDGKEYECDVVFDQGGFNPNHHPMYDSWHY